MYRKIEHIKTDEIEYIWTALVPFVDRIACAEYPLTSAQVYERLASGEYQCWIITEYEVIKTFGFYKFDDEEHAIHILGISGQPETEDDVFANVAAEYGCDLIRLSRPSTNTQHGDYL